MSFIKFLFISVYIYRNLWKKRIITILYVTDFVIRELPCVIFQQQNFSLNVSDPCGPLGSVIEEPYTDVFEAPCTKGSSTPPVSKVRPVVACTCMSIHFVKNIME